MNVGKLNPQGEHAARFLRKSEADGPRLPAGRRPRVVRAGLDERPIPPGIASPHVEDHWPSAECLGVGLVIAGERELHIAVIGLTDLPDDLLGSLDGRGEQQGENQRTAHGKAPLLG